MGEKTSPFTSEKSAFQLPCWQMKNGILEFIFLTNPRDKITWMTIPLTHPVHSDGSLFRSKDRIKNRNRQGERWLSRHACAHTQATSRKSSTGKSIPVKSGWRLRLSWKRLLHPAGKWWRRGGSNSRPSHCERDALPAELRPHEALVRANCLSLIRASQCHSRPCG